MNKLDKSMLNFLEKELVDIQKNIEKKLAKLNNNTPSKLPEPWKRKQGGGGKSISISGAINKDQVSVEWEIERIN